MTYDNIHKGIFIHRPNRFIAEVEIAGNVEICHVKNTGRCKELLTPGAVVYVNAANNPARVTKYDLVTVHKGERLINIDSQAPNRAFGEYLRQGKFLDLGIPVFVKPEAKYRNSRFDFYIETETRKAFIEVKGVTLEEHGVAMFPDAPTERGVKHLNELATCIHNGFDAYVVFVVQMKGVSYFMPNYSIHAAFGENLKRVADLGVKVVAYDCIVTPLAMLISEGVQICYGNVLDKC